MNENIEKVGNLIRSDRRLSIGMIVESIGINEESVQQISHNNLNMQKVCAKMVPKILTLDQLENHKKSFTDTLNDIENDPDLLKRVITCDESWFFTYDPQTKRQSMP